MYRTAPMSREHASPLLGTLMILRVRVLPYLFASFVLSLCPVQLWSRLMPPPSMADVRALAEKAPIVFRGRVVSVRPSSEPPYHNGVFDAIATIEVDRLYRGQAAAQSSVHFLYAGQPYGLNGHYCINFQPDGYWLVFAVERDGRLELFDDCFGALTISPLLGPNLKDAGWLAQMETDFVAGLSDASPAARVLSIQRLGGLKLPSSRVALHRVIDEGSADESNWAIYSALRTGDLTVLPLVKELRVGEDDWAEKAIAFELQHVTDAKAVPDLIAIFKRPHSDLITGRVQIALKIIQQQSHDAQLRQTIEDALGEP